MWNTLNPKSAECGRWGAVKVLSPLRQVADSSPLISICYRRTVAFRSGARFSFASVTPFQRFWVKEGKKRKDTKKNCYDIESFEQLRASNHWLKCEIGRNLLNKSSSSYYQLSKIKGVWRKCSKICSLFTCPTPFL